MSARAKVKAAIIDYIKEHQYPPTVRELCDLTGLRSTNTVNFHINNLIKNGELETDCGVGASRAIRVPGYKFVEVGNEAE